MAHLLERYLCPLYPPCKHNQLMILFKFFRAFGFGLKAEQAKTMLKA